MGALDTAAKIAKTAGSRLFAPTKTFERSGGQSTFIHPPAGTRNLGRGTYLINPVEASYSKESPLAILRKHQMDMSRMARIAEQQGEEDAKRRYGMIESALEDATMAGNKLNGNEEMRLLMQVDSRGSPVGAATFQRGDAYGLGNKDFTDLDFTGPEPGTLHSLGVLGATENGKPFMRGQDYIQKVQDMLGNDNLFFETINKPEFSNLEYYYNLGARPTGRTRGGGNPFYEFKQRAEREASEPNTDQLRLEGFAGGGLAKMGRGWWLNKAKNIIKEIPEGDLGPHGDHDGWIGIGKNARALGVDPRDAKALQRGSYGFHLPKKMSEEYVATGAEPLMQGRHAYYNAMMGDQFAPADELFFRLYGQFPDEAATGGVLGAGSSLDDLMRARLWPNNTLSVDSESGVTPEHVRKLWDAIGSEVQNPTKVRLNVTNDSGDLVKLPLMEALTKKRWATGGLAKFKECHCG